MNRVIKISLAVGLSASLLGSAPAQADSDSLAEQVASLSPGVSTSEIESNARQYARQNNQPYEAVLKAALSEGRQSAADSGLKRAGKNSTLSSGGSGTVKLGRANRTGDVFYSPASTLFISHGHSGIFYSTTSIVEAPGSGKTVRRISSLTRKVGKGAKKQTVHLSYSTRKKARSFAYGKRGKAYNKNFAFNRNIESSKYNCSQLVWAGFKKYGYDLDSNRGFGVYPSNIRDSGYTSTYRTL